MSVSSDIINAITSAIDPEVIDVSEAQETAAFIAAIAAGVAAAVSPVLLQVVSTAEIVLQSITATSFAVMNTPSVSIITRRDNSRLRLTAMVPGIGCLSSSSGQVYISFARTVDASMVPNISGVAGGLWGRSCNSSHGFISASLQMIDDPGLPAGTLIIYQLSGFRVSRDFDVGSLIIPSSIIVEELAV